MARDQYQKEPKRDYTGKQSKQGLEGGTKEDEELSNSDDVCSESTYESSILWPVSMTREKNQIPHCMQTMQMPWSYENFLLNTLAMLNDILMLYIFHAIYGTNSLHF